MFTGIIEAKAKATLLKGNGKAKSFSLRLQLFGNGEDDIRLAAQRFILLPDHPRCHPLKRAHVIHAVVDQFPAR